MSLNRLPNAFHFETVMKTLERVGACQKSRRDDRPQTGNTPVCVLSHLWCFSPDSNIKK